MIFQMIPVISGALVYQAFAKVGSGMQPGSDRSSASFEGGRYSILMSLRLTKVVTGARRIGGERRLRPGGAGKWALTGQSKEGEVNCDNRLSEGVLVGTGGGDKLEGPVRLRK